MGESDEERLDVPETQRLFERLRADLARAMRCRSEDGHAWGPLFDRAMRCQVCGVEALTEPEAEEERGPLGF